jgi:hypothetical protein
MNDFLHHGLCGRGRLELFEPHRKAVAAVHIDFQAGEEHLLAVDVRGRQRSSKATTSILAQLHPGYAPA